MNRQEEISCIAYFRQNEIWDRLLKGFWNKYLSYGTFSGTVKLTKISRQDMEVLEGFFSANYHGNKTISISATRFQKALKQSRYREITPERVLELYFGKKPVAKKEQKEMWRQRQEQIYEKVCVTYAKTPAKNYFPLLKEQIRCEKKTGLKEWEEQFTLAIKIWNALPYRRKTIMYLAVFAATLTGDPHAFDVGTVGGQLLNKVIKMNLEQRRITAPESAVFRSYKRQKSYLTVGIAIDDISNYAMFYQVTAQNGEGRLHKGMEGFFAEKDIVQVPLTVLMKWSALFCPQQTIYIVENPSIFAALCAKTSYNGACMCMNGQPRLAGLVALDLLAKTQTKIYYAGDFDPEGLLIAQKLSQYYKGEFHYWHMDVEDYLQCRSDRRISDRRLKIMEKVTDEKLRPVADKILQTKQAGYQESLLSQL